MKKVYVVTSGSYSDYSLEGIFSTMALAEAFGAQVCDRNGVQEWTLDEHADEVRRIDYRVLVALADGAELQRWDTEQLSKPNARVSQAPETRNWKCGDKAVLAASFVSFDHALKMARDFAAKERAKRAGIAD